MKIDLVYLWVDGSDPKWRAKKNAALAAAGRPPMKDDAIRFHDNDELKYSLRSAVKFAPWLNHIFIVTDGQTPKWLNAKNPKITVVNQTDIMPKEILPCFNSSVIEQHLVNIPNLSEHFIYANDDMFFGRPTKPGYFFRADGAPIIYARTEKDLIKKAVFRDYDSQLLNAKNLIGKIYGNTHDYEWAPCHNIDPYRKSYIQEMAAHPDIKPEIKKMIRHTFRSPDDLQRSIFHEYMMTNRLATMKIRNGTGRMFMRIFGRPFPMHVEHASRLAKMWKKPNLFCINNSGGNQATDEYNRNFLDKMFPEKSEFEK